MEEMKPCGASVGGKWCCHLPKGHDGPHLDHDVLIVDGEPVGEYEFWWGDGERAPDHRGEYWEKK